MRFRLIKNTYCKYEEIKIIRLDLNSEIDFQSFSQSNQDSIQYFECNFRKFKNISDLLLEKKPKSVKIKIICNVLNYSNQLISDTIENQITLRNQRNVFNLSQSPDYYFNFNDSSLTDVYGHASDLIAKNGVEFDSDRFGYSNSVIKFDGSSFLRYTDMQNLIFLKNNFTVSFWAKPSKAISQWFENYLLHPIHAGAQFGDGKGIGLSLGQNQVNISTHTDFWHTCEFTYDNDFKNWNQFTISVSVNKINLYVNGTLRKSSNTISDNLYFSLAYCKYYPNAGIGVAFGFNYSYTGLFDDLMLYKSALTDSEILNLYNETK